MKKTILFIMLLLATSLVSAASISTSDVNVTPGASFTINDLVLGSDDQTREDTATGTLTLTNTGNQTLTITLTDNVASQYQFTLGQDSVTLLSGESLDITATVYVPDTQDSGRKNIGTITATTSGLGSELIKTTTIYLETRSELEISKVKIEIDGESETVSDDEEVDAKAGDEVLLVITLKNNFDENIDIEDVQLNVESDSDLDWDDDKDVSDISDGDKEDIEFSFNIDSDIDEDEYDVEITVEGEDENGALHEDTLTFTVNIDRENHEVTIRSASLSPSKISCDGGTVTVRTNIENTGSNNENDISIVVENEDLEIYEHVTRLELDEDDDMDESFTFTVPKNTLPGEYLIHVTTYYDNDEESDEKILSLFVEECDTTDTDTDTGNGNTGTGGTTTQPPIVYPTGTIGPSYGATGFFNSTGYMILLALVALLIVVLIIVLLVKFVF